jgi:hypothetical protein
VLFGGYPVDANDRQNVFHQNTDRCYTQPILNQGKTLHQDVAGTKEVLGALEQVSPDSTSRRMKIIVGVEDGQQR